MNKTEKLKLVEGNFSNEEAEEILINIFSTKINFHDRKNFSSQVRSGKNDSTAQKRIPELKKEIEKLTQLIAEAKLDSKRFVTSSEINISILD